MVERKALEWAAGSAETSDEMKAAYSEPLMDVVRVVLTASTKVGTKASMTVDLKVDSTAYLKAAMMGV